MIELEVLKVSAAFEGPRAQGVASLISMSLGQTLTLIFSIYKMGKVITE